MTLRTEYPGSRELGQQQEVGGDGAAYGHARRAGMAGARDPGQGVDGVTTRDTDVDNAQSRCGQDRTGAGGD
jgi:hypothetical protein